MAGIATAIETLRNPSNRHKWATSIVHNTPPLHHNNTPESDQQQDALGSPRPKLLSLSLSVYLSRQKLAGTGNAAGIAEL